MAKSSIHFNAVKTASESHNYRHQELDYLIPELKGNFQNWSSSSIEDKSKEISKLCKKLSGRKLQKNAEPIKEAVVNLNPHHNMDDLKRLAEELQKQFSINCFQIHIHRDEGHYNKESGQIIINHHAHMLFDWQDKTKGTMLRLKNHDLSKIQTVVAEALQMERGELRTNSNRERLEAIEFKALQKEKELLKIELRSYEIQSNMRKIQYKEQTLQQNISELEQKKNKVRERINTIRERGAYLQSSDDYRIKNYLYDSITKRWEHNPDKLNRLSAIQIVKAIFLISSDIRNLERALSIHKTKQ